MGRGEGSPFKVPCCYGAATSGPCAAVRGAGNGCTGEVGGSITLQPLPVTSSQTVCTAAAARAAAATDAWWLCCLGTLTWRHLQQVLVGAWDPEHNPNCMEFPTVTLAIFLGIPGAGGYMFPLEVGSHYIRTGVHQDRAVY